MERHTQGPYNASNTMWREEPWWRLIKNFPLWSWGEKESSARAVRHETYDPEIRIMITWPCLTAEQIHDAYCRHIIHLFSIFFLSMVITSKLQRSTYQYTLQKMSTLHFITALKKGLSRATTYRWAISYASTRGRAIFFASSTIHTIPSGIPSLSKMSTGDGEDREERTARPGKEW